MKLWLRISGSARVSSSPLPPGGGGGGGGGGGSRAAVRLWGAGSVRRFLPCPLLSGVPGGGSAARRRRRGGIGRRHPGRIGRGADRFGLFPKILGRGGVEVRGSAEEFA